MKILKILGWLIFGPIAWLALSLCASAILAVALFQVATNKLPKKEKNFGLTPPDKSVILQN
jgi:hypothetical protein